jgi:hypothetical protein
VLFIDGDYLKRCRYSQKLLPNRAHQLRDRGIATAATRGLVKGNG